MKKLIQAYTLLEVLIVVAIIGLLSTTMVPFLTGLSNNAGLTTANNDLVAAFQYARSTAIRLQDRVVVCASNNANSATPTCGDGTVSWHDGWIIFHDGDNTAAYGGVADTLLSIHEKSAITGLSIEVVQAEGITNYVSFTAPAGEPMTTAAGNQAGIFKICLADEPGEIRGVQLNVSGRVASTRNTTVIGSTCP